MLSFPVANHVSAIRYGIGKEIIDPVAFIVKAKILSLRRYLVSEVRVLYANFLT